MLLCILGWPIKKAEPLDLTSLTLNLDYHVVLERHFLRLRSINKKQNSCNVYHEVTFSAQNNVLGVQILSSGKYAGVFFWTCQKLSNVCLT